MGNNDSITFKTYGTSSNSRKDVVVETVTKFTKKINNGNNFLKNFTFFIVEDFNDLPECSNLTSYVKNNAKTFNIFGTRMTTPKIFNNDKGEILVNISATGTRSIFCKYENDEILQQNIMHEIGHQFDDQFGHSNEELYKIAKTLPFETSTEEQEVLMKKYMMQKDLSDTDTFKNAWEKDIEKISGKKPHQFFHKMSYGSYYPYEVDISDGISKEEVDNADSSRSEIFAQLFSYAFGEDDGQRNEIIIKYSNSYNVVKQFIKENLNINLK